MTHVDEKALKAAIEAFNAGAHVAFIPERIQQAITAYLAALPPATEAWQPRETAPRDGTQVLLFFPNYYQGKGGISWGCFVNGAWLDSRAFQNAEFSHWMHMPPVPIREVRNP
jgi:hypothetical protein